MVQITLSIRGYHFGLVQRLVDNGTFKFDDWAPDEKALAFEVLGFDRIVRSSVCDDTGVCLVPSTTGPKGIKHILMTLLTQLSIATGGSLGRDGKDCILLRHSSKLVRRHAHGGYIDLICGKSTSGQNVVVQAHRLVCIACMDAQAVRKWCSGGKSFVCRHAVDCGRRKHCCSPWHMSPGTHKDNWDDLRKVREAESKFDRSRC